VRTSHELEEVKDRLLDGSFRSRKRTVYLMVTLSALSSSWARSAGRFPSGCAAPSN
jgi:hypothetical protein